MATGILLGSVIVAGLLVSLRPEPALRPLPSQIPFAITAPVVAGVGAIPVFGAGTVRPSAEIEVAAEVAGKVSWVNPAYRSGERVRQGQVLFRIDDADYRNRVQKARADVAAQKVALLQAEEDARIARSEYEGFRRREAKSVPWEQSSPLTRRQPQLEAAQAALARDLATLGDAELALARTEVRAPFDGVVRHESVDLGQFVAPGQRVGRLYATDAVEVVVPLADGDAALIPGLWELDTGDEDARVAVRVTADYGGGTYAWDGYLDRVAASLDEQTRTIDVVVRVPAPFTRGVQVRADDGEGSRSGADSRDRGGPPLLVGKFVEVRIQGIVPKRYFIVRRPALRPGSEVWAIREGPELTIVPVRVLQRTDDDVYVTGALEAGQAVVVGGIRLATEGMRVRIGAAESS